jgi:hypothetical protein
MLHGLGNLTVKARNARMRISMKSRIGRRKIRLFMDISAVQSLFVCGRA